MADPAFANSLDGPPPDALVPSVSWLWWNVRGCVVTLLVGHGAGRRLAAGERGLAAGGVSTAASHPMETAAEAGEGRRLALILVAEFGLTVGGLGLLALLV